MATEMAHPRRWRVLHGLREHGVLLVARARVRSIEEKEVRYEIQTAEGTPTRERVEADSVILAVGLAANPGLARSLEAAGLPTREIGDVTGVGYLEGAIRDGFRAALDL